MGTEAKKRVDWDAIEPHYRAGIRSLKDIGAEFEVSDAAIVKHAKKSEWTRNLKAKIQAKADAKVSAAVVSAEVSAQTKLTESVRVEIEAEVQARIRLEHRSDIAKARRLVMTMLSELEHQTGNVELLEKLTELLSDVGEEATKAQQDAQAKRVELFNKVISLGSRTGTMKQLADSLKTLVSLEREAFGIAVDAPKIEVTTKVDLNLNPQDMSDDELMLVATGRSKGTIDTPPSAG